MLKDGVLRRARKICRLPAIDKDHIVRKGKDLIPVHPGTIDSLKQSIRLPEISMDMIIDKSRHLISQSSYYEALFYNKIFSYSIPSISEMYANSKFKTAIYRADEESPCLDEIFYKFENLIPYGKEYWFAIFTSTDGKKPMQLVSCFGRRNSRRSVIDNVEVSGLNPRGNELNTVVGAWCFDGKRKVYANTVESKTITGKESITSAGNGLSMTMSGTVPEYRVTIDSKEITCDFKLMKPKSGYDVEVLNELKMGLNYQVYNLYYDFEGTLNGKKHKGRCYLQKVILSTPMPSWNWCRIVFKDGSFLVFFKPYIGVKELNYTIRNRGWFYSAKHDRIIWFNNIDVYYDKKQVNWRFKCNTESCSFDISVKAYADHCPTFRGAGAFDYHEFMVSVKKFKFVSGDVVVSMKDTGPGAGMVEDGRGIWI
ncbi:hypothetical protein [Methanocella arvoryzae]|uniref:AttH domain-containing protein n=1 Tax=Methanocella arvoryzae (strain DSM 22066 / NBRC 105507 / MRE50) TaxID=351160 RepID=Q0W6H2_METAR|nr:hypothetical protein [Methanocella arvoryzae]CAJ36021.1 hypothetical protein RCIX615 [Methanocella arvoryzae MRE50]